MAGAHLERKTPTAASASTRSSSFGSKSRYVAPEVDVNVAQEVDTIHGLNSMHAPHLRERIQRQHQRACETAH